MIHFKYFGATPLTQLGRLQTPRCTFPRLLDFRNQNFSKSKKQGRNKGFSQLGGGRNKGFWPKYLPLVAS